MPRCIGGFPKAIASSQYAQISPYFSWSIRIRQPSSGVTGGYPQDEQRTTTPHGPGAEVPIGAPGLLLAMFDFDLIIVVAFARLTITMVVNATASAAAANRNATLRNLFMCPPRKSRCKRVCIQLRSARRWCFPTRNRRVAEYRSPQRPASAGSPRR